MNISAEKEEIIRRFNLIHDVDLINAIKSLLDFGLHKQADNDTALNASIDKELNESKNGLGRPYEEFMADVRKRHRA